LPYSFAVDGRLSADRTTFGIAFRNNDDFFGRRTAGAPFNVYAPGAASRNWAYTVKAGDRLSDAWPLAEFSDGGYHLRVYGPNGFYREFRGGAGDPLDVTLEYGRYRGQKEDAVTRMANGELLLKNRQNTACVVDIVDHAYGAAPITREIAAGGDQRVALSFEKSHQWYDFSVRVKGAERFGQRYAGRVETGRDGISDPQLG
jgi:phospholipase C